VTAVDYAHSLNAAFPIDAVAGLARRHVQRPLNISASRFVDFFYFIRSADRCEAVPAVLSYVDSMRQRCNASIRLEARMLGALQRAA
jgi:hypothetical protein